MRKLACLVVGMTLTARLGVAPMSVAQQGPAPQRAVPVEPVAAILDAFRSYPLVALGEGTHDNEQGHAFRLALIRDPRFTATVNDIVVEFGNSLYQDRMDRFVRGEDVSYDLLRQVWQNTTQPHPLWDAPIYEEFFRAVRVLNASLPRDRKLRVLLGDPPIDWDAVKSQEDIRKFDARDRYPADVIRREVLAKQRRALVIYGDLHLIRRNPNTPPQDDPDGWALSIVGVLERAKAAKMFTIRTVAGSAELDALQPDVPAWPRPSLAVIRGTVLGAASFSFYFPRPLVAGTIDRRRPMPMEEQFDALLYLGPLSTITLAQLSPALCSDSGYMEMRMLRMALAGMGQGPPGGPNPVARLKEYCATVAVK
jgi:hypothetical protein